MARYLVLTWYGAGNQPPAVGLAQELVARGNEVIVAGYERQRGRFGNAGFHLLRHADTGYKAASAPPSPPMAGLVEWVWACPEHLADVADLPDADGIVVDCLMFGALAALEQTDRPVTVLVHSAPGALVPPGGAMEELLLGPVNQVRCRAGLPSLARLWDAWTRFPTLFATVAELDPLPEHPPGRFVGPLTERLPASGWRPPWPADDPRPLAVLSFSTGPAWDQTSRLRRTIDAVGGRYRLVALTGPFDATPTGDAVVRHFLPHGEVLPAAAITITHAGHGTVAASLAHGVPLLCLPNPAADQPALARRVEQLGAGLTLDGEQATTPDIAAAADAVIADPAMAKVANALAGTLAAAPGLAGAADAVEAQVGTVNRPRVAGR